MWGEREDEMHPTHPTPLHTLHLRQVGGGSLHRHLWCERGTKASTNLQEKYPEVVIQLKKLLADFVNRGRSTAGEAQKNDPFDKDWKELWPVMEYLNEDLRNQVNKKQ